ncbi:hypothetical protein HK105_205776 [Polyrhizophydium stewartii]|uniref:Uncharacterized protein n=1 Tax=Polyrhizophydium stewartii TaxID=2732419 RepID=A0ABR4N571_9FUNG|nr:hypothetical protein HK105_008084 [Polyrhizophydium stewartii]
MAGFFEQNPALWLTRPRFVFGLEYFGLAYEIFGLLCAVGNCVFLAMKIRKASSGLMLKGLFVGSIFCIVMIISHFFLLYWSFTAASLTVLSWASTIAQIIIITVEAGSLKIFIPDISDRTVYSLHFANMLASVALAAPSLLRGYIFMDAAEPHPVALWYRSTLTFWLAYCMFFDFAISCVIVARIINMSRNSLKNLRGISTSKTGTQPSTVGATATVAAGVSANSNAEEIKTEFEKKTRITIVWMVLFFIVNVVSIVGNALYVDFDKTRTLNNILISRAYIQIALGCSGPHVVCISVMLYNVTQIVRASRGQTSSGKGSKDLKASGRHLMAKKPGGNPDAAGDLDDGSSVDASRN